MKKDGRGGARVGAGRPKGSTIYKDDKRDKQLTLRLATREIEMITNLSKKLNISRTDTIIKAVENLCKENK